MASDGDVADPGKVVLPVGSLFAALEGGEIMSLILQVVDPGEVLNDAPLSMGEAVFGSVVAQRHELREQRGQRAVFEGEDEVPAVFFAEVEDGLAGVEGIA